MRYPCKATQFLGMACVLAVGLAYGGCGKKFSSSTTPQITYGSISPQIAREAKDTININMTFLDGDGDLGPANNEDTTTNVFVIDRRSGNSVLSFTYRLPYITPPGSNKAIKGDIQLHLPQPFRRLGHPRDTAKFDVQIADRAGHRSNTITTSPVIIIP